MAGDELHEPLTRLAAWLADAEAEATIRHARAACLATVDAHGRPDARVVLVHAIDDSSLLFATDARSAKAAQLAANPYAALVFHWDAHERQARVRGPVTRAGDDDADRGFADRPRRSRITAWASVQSRPLDDPDRLRDRYREAAEASADEDPVPRPDSWIAFRLHAEEIELWTAGACRLHHRERFTRAGGRWRHGWLEP